MRLARFVMPATLLVMSMHCQRADDSPSAKERRRASRYLMQLDEVDTAHIGAIGNLSRDALALRILLEGDDAQDRFTELVQRAKIGGRLIGLCGLKLLGSPEFQSSLKVLGNQRGEVGGMQGCMVGGSRPVADVLHDIEAGAMCAEYAGTGEPESLRAEYRKVGFTD